VPGVSLITTGSPAGEVRVQLLAGAGQVFIPGPSVVEVLVLLVKPIRLKPVI
jgi:hypothetical protein